MEKEMKKLDSEWVQLLTEARKAGLTVEEVRHFLKSHQKSSESLPL
ncbi:anti-repressor SinI family protein [Bacillus sp. Bos-x628]